MFFPLFFNPRRTLSSSIKISTFPSLQALLKSGFTPTLKSINQFFLFLFRHRKFDLIINFFSQMSKNKIMGNTQTHSILTRALLKSNKYEEAEHFMSTHVSESFQFHITRLWDTLIQGFCIKQEDPERALSVLRDCLKKQGILPSSFTFSSLVHKFSSEGNMGKVIEVLVLMTDKKFKYPFDNFVCSSVISGFCKAGNPELAMSFFENAVSSGALQPNIVTYTSLVTAFCMLGKVREIEDLVCRIEKEGLAFDVFFYSNWVCGFVEDKSLMDVLKKKREMVGRGIDHDVMSYTILIDGFSKLGDVEKAIGFLEMMRKAGLKPNCVTYTSIISGFCKKGKLGEALTLFEGVEDQGIEPDEFMFATIIDGFSRRGDFSCVFRLLDEMEKRRIKPSIVTYNTVINGLCKFGRTSEAEEFSKNVAADIITYCTLLYSYAKEKNTPRILEIKRRMEEAGIPMDVVMCNVLIKALFMVGAFDDVLTLYKGMPEMDIVADSVTYCTLIEGFCKVGRMDEALEIFDEFRRTSISSYICYNTIIRGLCKRGMAEMATDVFVEFNEQGLALGLGTCRMLMNAIFKEKSTKGILDLVNRIEGLGAEMYDTFCNGSIKFLSKRGLASDAIEIYMILRRKGSSVTCKTYYVFLRGLIRSGKMWQSLLVLNNFLKEYGIVEPRVKKIVLWSLCLKSVSGALYFSDKMKENSSAIAFPVSVLKALTQDGKAFDAYRLVMEAKDALPAMDVVDYSIMVDGLCKGGYVLEALDICALAEKKGITLNIVAYNSIMNGLCYLGCFTEAFRLLDALENIDLVPSEITYATLIYALCEEGLLLDAKHVFQKMVAKGFQPKTQVYNSLIDNFCKFGQIEEALRLLHDMEIKLVKPDNFTISALINGYSHKGNMEEALGFFLEYKRKGILPDLQGFLYMIRGLCAKGRMEESRSVLREMLLSPPIMELIDKVNAEVETESIRDFLALLCDQGSIQEAITVLNEIASMLFPLQSLSNSFRKSYKKQNRVYDGFSTVSSTSVTSRSEVSLSLGSCTSKDLRKVLENNGITSARSQFADFDLYYCGISSLCSRGELQKANLLVKEMLSVF